MDNINHAPLVVGLAGLALTVLGGAFTGGIAWGKVNKRTSIIEQWIEKHEEWAHQRSSVVDELRQITVRLDTLIEAQEGRLNRIERHEDESL